MEESIRRACCGELEDVSHDDARLRRCVARLAAGSRVNTGVRDGAVAALLSRAALDDRYIEITQVVVAPESRRQGCFKTFTSRVQHTCVAAGKGLVVGAVTSHRMLQICKQQGWPRMDSDPTSFVVCRHA
jgi:hypothetical protein